MCDTLVILRPGEVWFAKSSDRDPNEAQVLEWHPRRRWDASAEVQATWIRIPQVRETHAVLLSRPYWMWGAEIGANEHGVTIGNEAVFTREPLARRGLTGMDLNRLALERADSAARAVEVILALLEQHGQGGGCGHERRAFSYHNSFLVADAAQAFVIDTAGAHHAVERLTAGDETVVRSISNALSIEPFARRHGDWLKTRVSRARARSARTFELAARAREPRDLASVLRDHGETRWPRYSLVNGAMGGPCMHAGGLVASSQTTASWISVLRPGRARHWATGTAAPCTSIFKPIDVHEPVDLGRPVGEPDDASLWWRHERFHRQVARDPAAADAVFSAERDGLEAEWFADPPPSGAAFEEADRRLEAWSARVAAAVTRDLRPVWARAYWRRRTRFA